LAVDRNKLIASAQKYLQRGQVRRAIRDYETIAAAYPDDIRILLKIADLQARENMLDESVRTYGEVADYYVAHGFYLKAVAVYKQLTRVRPDPEAFLHLAGLYAQLSLFSDALAQYQVVAQQRLDAGDALGYIDVLRRMVEIDPSRVGNRIKLAEHLLKQGAAAEALQHFAAAADVLHQQGRFEEYIKVAERLVHTGGDEPARVRQLAAVYLQMERPQRAVAALQPLFRQEQYELPSIQLLVRAFRDMGELDRAIHALQDLLVVLEKHQGAELEAVAELLLELHPQNAQALRLLGREDNPGAGGQAAHLRPVLTSEEVTTLERMTQETDVYLKYNLFEKSLGHLDAMLDIDPGYPPALERRASVFEQTWRPKEAAADLARLALSLAVSEGRMDAARTAVDRARALHPETPLLAQAVAALEQGEVPLLELEPDDYLVEDDTEASIMDLSEDDTRNGAVLEAVEELDALFDDFSENSPSQSMTALDQDLDFIRDIESSLGEGRALETASEDPKAQSALQLSAGEFLPVDLDEALNRASRLGVRGSLADAHEVLLELMGQYPEHAEVILARLESLPTSEQVARSTQTEDVPVLTPDTDVPVPSLPGSDHGAGLEDLFSLDDEDEDVDPVEYDAPGHGVEDMHALDVLDDVEILDDVPDVLPPAPAASTVTEDEAPVGRPSPLVRHSFSLTGEAILSASFREAVDAARDSRFLEAMDMLGEEIFGDHPVAASYELAVVRLRFGDYMDAAGSLGALENAPALSDADRALILYQRALCLEAMGMGHEALPLWHRILRMDAAAFPDVPVRVRRAGG
jgi:tetratricopeptide (TPR) repeat protein